MDLEQHIADLEREEHFRRIDATVTIGPRYHKVVTRPSKVQRLQGLLAPRNIGSATSYPKAQYQPSGNPNGNLSDRAMVEDLRSAPGKVLDTTGDAHMDELTGLGLQTMPEPHIGAGMVGNTTDYTALGLPWPSLEVK